MLQAGDKHQFNNGEVTLYQVKIQIENRVINSSKFVARSRESLLWCLDHENPVRGEGGGHEVEVDVVRHDVLLPEMLAMPCRLDNQLISVELDRDVVRAVLLHVQGKLVLVPVLHLQQNCCLSSLVRSWSSVVGRPRNLVVHLGRGRHGRRGHGVVFSGSLAGGGRGHGSHLLYGHARH